MSSIPPADPTAPSFADSRASDPVALGWMTGSPPPPDKLVRFEDGSFLRFPMWRWSFSHWREFAPTVNVPRGAAAPSPLPRAERDDLDAVRLTPLASTRTMSWAESLAANYTDGIVVLHRGHIAYERYFGALTPERPHIAFSVTKSFFGIIAATLMAEGALDPVAPVRRYVPELAASGFGDATVTQVLDMTTALKYTEIYADPASDFVEYARASGLLPRPADYGGAKSTYEYLQTIAKTGEHGPAFAYRSINTDVVGWLIARVTQAPPHELLRARIWSLLGAEDDAHLQVDSVGTPLVAVALNARLRDLARFASHPLASNVNLDPISLPAYHAVARHLLAHPG